MSPWQELEIPEGFREDGRKAPLAIGKETAATFRRTLLKLLAGENAPPQGLPALEAGLSTAASLLEGAQGFLSLANQLVSQGKSAPAAAKIGEDLLRTVGALLGHRNAAYAIHQVAGVLTTAPGVKDCAREIPRVPRLRDYMSRLEELLERTGADRVIESDALGPLCVHLDEFYDDCALVLRRFYLLLEAEDLGKARAMTPDFLRRLYTDFAHASFADHLLGEAGSPPEGSQRSGRPGAAGPEGPPEDIPPSKAGLRALLPRLTDAFNSL